MDDDLAKSACLKELESMLQKLHGRNIRVTLLLSVPSGDELDPRNELKRSLTRISLKKLPALTIANFLDRVGWTRGRLAEIGRDAGAEVIDPLTSLSTNGICISENKDGPIRYNDCHLRPAFVKEHIKYLDATVAP